MSSDLLGIDDPLLAVVRRRAMVDREAHSWLIASARRWAIGQFHRREQQRERGERPQPDRDAIGRELERLAWHQVAVRVYMRMLGGQPDMERVWAGLLRPSSNPDYLSLELPGGGGEIAGMMLIADIFELPTQWRTQRWPEG